MRQLLFLAPIGVFINPRRCRRNNGRGRADTCAWIFTANCIRFRIAASGRGTSQEQAGESQGKGSYAIFHVEHIASKEMVAESNVIQIGFQSEADSGHKIRSLAMVHGTV